MVPANMPKFQKNENITRKRKFPKVGEGTNNTGESHENGVKMLKHEDMVDHAGVHMEIRSENSKQDITSYNYGSTAAKR